MSFSKDFLNETTQIINNIELNDLEQMVNELVDLKESKGRLFICGVGGSAGHAGHAVNDFRKLAGIESYSPTDNVSELTARANDEGWDTVFTGYLKVSQFNSRDALLILSVGGGSENPQVSTNLIEAVKYANEINAKVFGIVGRKGGFTKQYGSSVVVIPELFPNHVTPHTEGIAAILWHLIVSHPKIKENATKW